MPTYYPKGKYKIPTSYKVMEGRKNDHEDRVAIANASDYMPPIPKYERQDSGVWKPSGVWGFISSIISLP